MSLAVTNSATAGNDTQTSCRGRCAGDSIGRSRLHVAHLAAGLSTLVSDASS